MTDQSNFVISTRNIKGKGAKARFGSEPGETRYLEVPAGELTPLPRHGGRSPDKWLDALTQRATTGRRGRQTKDPRSGYVTGDILIFVHGYNNSMEAVMQRHDLLQKNLKGQGFKGAVVSFDWPSAELTLGYMEDRRDALATSQQLVDDGIKLLAQRQLMQDENKCDIDIHLLGHSTGAYVIREGFYLADQSSSISRINWQVSQIAFVGGDIARKSMSSDDGKSQSLFNHSARITNYQNPYDSALRISNIKRAGTAPRVGRVGLPDDAHDSVVNVHTGDYWEKHIEPLSDDEIVGNNSHSWHFSDEQLSKDLAFTLAGDIDRRSIPTRRDVNGELHLRL